MLLYLPPTMSPPETCPEGEYLEHPDQAFAYYRNQGVSRVICEEKHMGSRAVLVVCRDEKTAESRYGIPDDGIGKVYTRTGRPFFTEPELESQFLDRVRSALSGADFWKEFEPTGCAWTPSSCRGRPKRKNCCARSTPLLVLRLGMHSPMPWRRYVEPTIETAPRAHCSRYIPIASRVCGRFCRGLPSVLVARH